MTSRGSRAAFGALVAAGLLVLVWAATVGPVGILSASGRRFEFNRPPPPTPSVEPPGPGKTLQEATRDVEQTLDLRWLGDLIIWAIFLGLLLLAFLAIRRLWRDRLRRPPPPEKVEFEVLPEPRVAEALREDARAQLSAVEEGSPRNGIVACWLRLEEVVAAAGLPRRPWETAAEYTVRILHALDLDPRPIGRLSALYREARFSEHHLDESARTTARAALEQLHTELDSAARRRTSSNGQR